jgi:hypothetical protein
LKQRQSGVQKMKQKKKKQWKRWKKWKLYACVDATIDWCVVRLVLALPLLFCGFDLLCVLLLLRLPSSYGCCCDGCFYLSAVVVCCCDAMLEFVVPLHCALSLQMCVDALSGGGRYGVWCDRWKWWCAVEWEGTDAELALERQAIEPENGVHLLTHIIDICVSERNRINNVTNQNKLQSCVPALVVCSNVELSACNTRSILAVSKGGGAAADSTGATPAIADDGNG